MEIDLVYLWVDGTDPAWVAKKNSYLPTDRQIPVEAAGDCRYVQNDELRYSLRSAEMFAPWIRRIHIVTDGQTPAWLDTSNPRVRVVFHRDFIPEEVLPLFNSCAIEYFLARIPGLSEHFLYANDDMFFGAPVEPGFFFDGEGREIVRLKKQRLRRHLDQIYSYTIYRMQRLVEERLGKRCDLAPHHNIDAYTKSDFTICWELFGEELERRAGNRFRQKEDLQRCLFHYVALAQGWGVVRTVDRTNGTSGWWERWAATLGLRPLSVDSRCIPVDTPDIAAAMDKYRPKLFCLNDEARASIEDRRRVRRFLETMFPNRSAFEKEA